MNDYSLLFLGVRLPRATWKLIDDVLLAQAGRIWEETRGIAPPGAQNIQADWQKNWQVEEQRKSLLGQLLVRVAGYANHSYSTTAEEVKRAMKQILRLLYGDPLGEGYTVPEQFHKTELGTLFNQVHWRILGPEGFMTPGQVVKELGIARTTLYNRVNHGTLHPIYLSNGEIRLLRSEIEVWKKQRGTRRKSSS
jgi:predicted DNA-binding transcriptional regulator AlpA